MGVQMPVHMDLAVFTCRVCQDPGDTQVWQVSPAGAGAEHRTKPQMPRKECATLLKAAAQPGSTFAPRQ